MTGSSTRGVLAVFVVTVLAGRAYADTTVGNITVPLPAAFWMLLSGLLATFALCRIRQNR
jgi:hypothetical protein